MAQQHRPSELFDTLKACGVTLAVSVPDSWLGEILIKIDADDQIKLIRATHEEEALAIACGARAGGGRPVMIVQNVGLLSTGAGMVCLAQRYRFPLLVLASYRGTPEDAVFYHIPKGRVTEPVFDGFGLNYGKVDPDAAIGRQVEQAALYAEESSSPYILLMGQKDIQW